jgi:hypothetical protein
MIEQVTTLQPRASALAVMADKFHVEPAKLLETLKNTVFRNATNDELLALVVVSNEYGLNPLTKEIYAFPAKGGGIVPVVSIDGWIRMMNDHPQFDGIDYQFQHDEQGRLVSCTAIIYRKDRSHPTRVTEYLAECRRNTEPWKMESRMLRHKATIQGARVAFGFSGITDEDEAAATPGLAGAKDVTPKPARNVPLDPFTQPMSDVAQTIEAEVIQEVAEPTQEDMLATDLLEAVADSDAENLASYVEQANAALTNAKQEMVKKAIAARAKALGVKWNKEKGGFEA